MFHTVRADDNCQTVTMRMGTHDVVILVLDHAQTDADTTSTEVLQRLTTAREVNLGTGTLTARQKQVLEYLAQGLTMRQIGARMGYSDSTIRMESLVIYRTLGDMTETMLCSPPERTESFPSLKRCDVQTPNHSCTWCTMALSN